MFDFLYILEEKQKNGRIEVSPDFNVIAGKDLMIKGGYFYAAWLEDIGAWTTDEFLVQKLIDEEIHKKVRELKDKGADAYGLYLKSSRSGMVDRWKKYCTKQMNDNFHPLDSTLIFSNTPVSRENYSSKQLDYPLEKGDIRSWDRIIGTLYSPEERHKIEWAIGSIVNGDSKRNQKFLVFYGSAGTGKSTILNIIQMLFKGYYTSFEAKALGSANASFALEPFRNNPLVAIQHDGDLSKIEDNTRLNSLISHEEMSINEKFKSSYTAVFESFLFMGTNRPVKITDSRSGIIRRLIDVIPDGNKIPRKEYNTLMNSVKFELGAIAYHCKEVYEKDPYYYDSYIPKRMMTASNDFYNYIEENCFIFNAQEVTTLKQAWDLYKVYCEEANVPYPMTRRAFTEELKNYFRDFKDRYTDEEGKRLRSVYIDFKMEKISGEVKPEKQIESESEEGWLKFDTIPSIFDDIAKDYPAQYADEELGRPQRKWAFNKTVLKNIDTSKLHYVKLPENHIIIDFDIKNDKGEKDLETNMREALKFPPTYAELSKSGGGIHLHYLYSGDVTKLSSKYNDKIEIKVYVGDMSLRRKLTKCNDIPIATINSGLPFREEKVVISKGIIKNEKALRRMIERCLNKEFEPYKTRTSINFMYDILEEAYAAGYPYDLSKMYETLIDFANHSTNSQSYCIGMVNKMKLKSEVEAEYIDLGTDKPIAFFDIEVFPNLFICNYKEAGEDKPVIRLINPKPSELEILYNYRLVGFNNRKYDNHIIYAALLGYPVESLYRISKDIIAGKKEAFFRDAYNLSYTDIYDYSSKKQSLKKWEIELKIHHQELGLEWDQPVPEDLWELVAEYCDNDVIATEAVFNKTQGDFIAREILAELTGLNVNTTTNTLSTAFIFEGDRNPQLVYTDLATGKQDWGKGYVDNVRTDIRNDFPGYEFVWDDQVRKYKNIYRGTDLKFGGYVYANYGMYGNVALIDIESMHPTSAIDMNYFGKYTQRFADLKYMRVLIKHKRFDEAAKLFDGKLAKYLNDPAKAKALAQALKIVINAVYGLTSAKFDNAFRDKRNKNNIVALRGALFMRTLQDEIETRGYKVAHIKTDSIKIPDASPEIIDFCLGFAERYGYKFVHEATYDRMCLVNDAVYIAKYKTAEECQAMYGYIPDDNAEHGGQWTATGKQFAVPYVFKSLFSKEHIEFEDMCETFNVSKGSLYLDMNQGYKDVSLYEDIRTCRRKLANNAKLTKAQMGILDRYSSLSEEELTELILEGHNYNFVGRIGLFCPILPNYGGGDLVVKREDNKYDAATGSKGYKWLETETILGFDSPEKFIDKSYYERLVDDAKNVINKYGIECGLSFEWFVSDEPYISPEYDLKGAPLYLDTGSVSQDLYLN